MSHMVAERAANDSRPTGLDEKARTMVAETVTRDDKKVSETMTTSGSCGGRGGDWECNVCGIDVVGLKKTSRGKCAR